MENEKTNEEMQTTAPEKEYNTVFRIFIEIWTLFGTINLFMSVPSLLISGKLYSELMGFVILGIIVNVIYIIGLVLIIYYNKLGVYLVTTALVLNFVGAIFTGDLATLLGSLLGTIFMCILFFSLKKNGVTAYNILFPKRDSK